MSDEKDTIQEIRERLVKIETLLENMNKTDALQRQLLEEKLKLVEEQLKVANKRIKDLEENQKWTWRTVAGGFITGAIAFLYKFNN